VAEGRHEGISAEPEQKEGEGLSWFFFISPAGRVGERSEPGGE
jgi:hypothetical protein